MEKLRILITGPKGFLAKELRHFLGEYHTIIDQERFDVTDNSKVEEVLTETEADVVIHTATRGGKRTRKDTLQDLIDNVTMFNNLVKNRSKYKLLFCFCSGAAFNRDERIYNISESEILTRKPSDYYGLSKNLIAREALQYDNVFNFRLFGCFGKGEEPGRFFPSVLRNIMSDTPVDIHLNREMDFFSTSDVAKVILYYLDNYKNQNLPGDINLVYPEKLTLEDQAGILIDEVTGSACFFGGPNQSTIEDKPYTGDSSRLKSLGVDLKGLVESIRGTYGGTLYE